MHHSGVLFALKKGFVMLASQVTIYFIGPHRIACDDKNKALIIDSFLIIRFSSTQYKLLKPLVENSPVPVTDADLVQAAYSSENWRGMHDNLEKHMDNIRSKLRPFGINAYRISTYGYILLAIPGYNTEPESNSPRNHL